MQEIVTHTRIEAAPERIWSVLMDFEAYPSWNPFITAIAGKQAVGEKLSVIIKPADKKPMKIKPKIMAMDKEYVFAWKGHLFMPGLFDGEHRFQLMPDAEDYNVVCFTQSERFTGLLSRPVLAMLKLATTEGFDLMNQALKEVCEGAKL